MLGTNVLLDSITDLVAADTALLANAAALHLHLAAAPFVPSVSLVVGGLTEATFTGSAAKAAGIGTQDTFVDPISGLRTIQIKEPAGGWTWICTVNPGAPETIYGVYLTDNADAVLFGSQLLPTPVTIQAAGEAVTWPDVWLQLVASALR